MPGDDDDSEFEAANERAAAKIKEDSGDEEPPPKRKAEGDEEVELNDEGEEEGESGEEPARVSRAEKRRNRFREAQERARNLEEENARLQRAAAEADAHARRMSQIAQGQQRPEQEEADPAQEKIAQARREQRLLYQEYTSLPEDQQRARFEEFQAKQDAIEDKKLAAIKEASAPRVDPMAARRAAIQESIKMQYPDVMGHERGAQVVGLNYNKLLALGHRDSPETLSIAMAQTRKELRITPQRPTPSSTVRQRLSGSAVGGGSGGAATRSRSSITVTPEQRKMARSAFPHMDAEKAVKHWANTVGRKMLEDGDLDE